MLRPKYLMAKPILGAVFRHVSCNANLCNLIAWYLHRPRPRQGLAQVPLNRTQLADAQTHPFPHPMDPGPPHPRPRIRDSHWSSMVTVGIHSAHATAMDIPPELFKNILNYIAAPNYGNGPVSFSYACWRLHDCSLVCAFWAEKCRQIVYQGAQLEIWSRTRADGLRWMALKRSSSRITPIPELIKNVAVHIKPRKVLKDDGPSWLHLLFAPLVHKKLSQSPLMMDHEEHTFPRRFPLASFKSPHWSLPRSIPPSFSPYRKVELRNMHFHSYSNFVKFIGHFTHAEEFTFAKMTWDANATGGPGPLRSFTARRRPLKKVTAEGCTDNTLVFLQATKQDSVFPFPLWHQQATIDLALAADAALKDAGHPPSRVTCKREQLTQTKTSLRHS